MQTDLHRILLHSDEHFHGKLPPQHFGRFLAWLPVLVRDAVSMALRFRSKTPGKRPNWLSRATDVRFVGHEGNGASVMFFEAPRLGDAAQALYSQRSLLPEFDTRPAPEDTAFDVLGDVLFDLRERNVDSIRVDPPFLTDVVRLRSLLGSGPFREIDFTSRRFPAGSPARFTAQSIESARAMLGSTPVPLRVRVVGRLDGLEAGTQRFSVLLDSGDKVVGDFSEDRFETMRSLWGRRVLVVGTAVYRASGRLLRIEAEDVRPGESESALFSRLPTPSGAKLDPTKLRKPQGPRSGLQSIVGKWPGNETEEELTALLEELS